jgi:hypothetical protein
MTVSRELSTYKLDLVGMQEGRSVGIVLLRTKKPWSLFVCLFVCLGVQEAGIAVAPNQ